MPKNKKLVLNSGIQSYQILTNDDEVCIPSLSSILLTVLVIQVNNFGKVHSVQHFIDKFESRLLCKAGLSGRISFEIL